MEHRYKLIRFNQFGGSGVDDELILFAAPADVLTSWAGIPRKGWRVRMLYQRWVTQGREKEVTNFWDAAATSGNGDRRFLVGPTALTLAATQGLDINEDGIALSYRPAFSVVDPEFVQLQKAAAVALDTITPRLTEGERIRVGEAREGAPSEVPSEYEPNHVLQSAVQIGQIAYDAESFCSRNEISAEERGELLEALDALCRPALVVDGQHRLVGAARSKHTVILPVVLIPGASWLEQIYQFIVINETAKRVSSDLLTDIFGNSLTPNEQETVRGWLASSRVQVESRIAAVVAGSHADSPFKDMVRLKLGSNQATRGFITEITVRQLIDGGRGATPGWRTDPEFYTAYVRHTYRDPEEWESWTAGRWRDYWFSFWGEVGSFYNSEAQDGRLWADEQTNLTKAVTLRLIQELFMRFCIEEARAAEKAAESLRAVLESRMTEQELDAVLEAEAVKASIPQEIHEFRRYVREEFLAKGIPVRVFEKPWVSSLDDASGINDLRLELRKAFDLSRKGERYKARNKAVFAVEDKD